MDDMAHRARFAAAMTAITRRLPFGLSEVVAPSLVGYLLINLCTFFIDLGLLGLFHGTFGWPVPARGDPLLRDRVGDQLRAQPGAELPQPRVRRQAVPGLRRGEREQLPHLRPRAHRPAVRRRGVLQFSRVIAACCEAVYLYCMMRWVVFRDADAAKAGPAMGPAGLAAQAPAPTASAGLAAQAPPPTASARPAAQAPRPGDGAAVAVDGARLAASRGLRGGPGRRQLPVHEPRDVLDGVDAVLLRRVVIGQHRDQRSSRPFR